MVDVFQDGRVEPRDGAQPPKRPGVLLFLSQLVKLHSKVLR